MTQAREADASRTTAALLDLVVFVGLLERRLCEATRNRSGKTLAGRTFSVAEYLHREIARERDRALHEHLQIVLGAVKETFARVQVQKHEQADDVAETFQPDIIRAQARVALPWRILGLHEVAYWREFRRRYGRVEVGAQRDKSDSGGVAPWNWRSKDFAASRRALCEEKRPMLEALNSAASAEAVAQLIAFAGQVERELCNALGRTEETLPGCDSTVREYADRFFRGEAGVLLDHLEHTLEVADEVFRSAGRWDCVADVLNPGAIMSKAHAGALFRMLGLQEVAYWREFERRAWDFNASKVVELADAR